jgi:hypothetical protein
MQRRYVLAGLAVVAALALAMPATGAESALSLAKRALSTAKKADKTGRIANGRAVRAINSIRRGVPRANRVDSVRPFKHSIGATLGTTAITARAAAPDVHLFSAGPTEVYAKCFRNTTGTIRTNVEVFVRTSAAGTAVTGGALSLDGNPTYLEPSTAELSRRISSTQTADNTASSAAGTHVSIAATGGTAFEAEISRFVKAGTPPGGNGLYGAGNICLVNGNVIG